MSGLALYEIAAEYRTAATALSELDLDEQTVTDTLEGLAGDFETKARNVAFFERNLVSLAEQIKEAESRMVARRKALENRANRIRDYLKSNMEATGITEISCAHFAIKIKRNPESVKIDCEGLIPDIYMRMPPEPQKEPDKKLIAAAIKAGLEIPGAHMERSTRLEIK